MIEHADLIRAIFMAGHEPAITADHRKVIGAFRATWVPLESGAPGIDALAPFGVGVDVIEHALQLLQTGDRRYAVRVVAEAARILPSYLTHEVQVAPGSYPVPGELAGWRGVDGDLSFRLRTEHVTLLKGVAWREVDSDSIADVLAMDTFWPMPYIDGKRPYGNSCYFQLDMAKLLGEPYMIGVDQYAIGDAEKDDRLQRLHEEMLPALQVILKNAASLS